MDGDDVEESRFFVEGLDPLDANHPGTTMQTSRYMNESEYCGFVPEKRVRVADSDRTMQCTRKLAGCCNPPPLDQNRDQNEEMMRQFVKLKETMLTIKEDVLSMREDVLSEILSMRKDFEDVGAIITQNFMQDG